MEYAILIFSGGVLFVAVIFGKLLYIGKGKTTYEAIKDANKQMHIDEKEFTKLPWKKMKNG